MAIARAVPETVSRNEQVAFWDLLFPRTGQDEEDTVVEEGFPAQGVAGMIREKREAYGMMGRRGVRIGVASAIVAVSAGGVMLWKGTGPTERGKSPVVAKETSHAGSMDLPSDRDVPDPGAVAAPAGASGTHSQQGSKPERSPPFPLAGDPSSFRSGVRPEDQELPRKAFSESHDLEHTKGDTVLPGKRRQVWIETDPAGVSVGYENGTSLGSTPLRLDTAPLAGEKIYFRKEGYITRTVSADALRQVPSFRIAMERRMGTLEVVQAIPWANVYEGERYLGVTPISSLKLPVGEHRLRFVNEPLGVDRVETVTIAPGTNPKLIVPLVGTR